MNNQADSENITIAIEHIYCCQKPQYSKYIITRSSLYDEFSEFINSYSGSYFLEDCPGRLGAILLLSVPLPISKDEYDLIRLKYFHIHC